MTRAMRSNGKRRDRRAKKGERNGRFRNVLPLCGWFRERGRGKYRSISLLKTRRTVKESFTRKSAPGLLSAHVRLRRRISCLVEGLAATGSYRGQFNFNLDRNRELPLRFDGLLSYREPALDFPRLAHVRDPTFASYCDYDCSGSGWLRRSKVNRRYYCTE